MPVLNPLRTVGIMSPDWAPVTKDLLAKDVLKVRVSRDATSVGRDVRSHDLTIVNLLPNDPDHILVRGAWNVDSTAYKVNIAYITGITFTYRADRRDPFVPNPNRDRD